MYIYKHMHRNITYLHIHIILDQHTENYDLRFMIQDSTNSQGCFPMLTCSLFVTPHGWAWAYPGQGHVCVHLVTVQRSNQPRQSKLLQPTSRSHLLLFEIIITSQWVSLVWLVGSGGGSIFIVFSTFPLASKSEPGSIQISSYGR